MWLFSFRLNIYINYLESLTWGGLFNFYHFCFFFFFSIFISGWTHGDEISTLFCYSNCSSISHWEFFSWLLYRFDIFPLLCILSTLLFFGNTICYKLIFYISIHSPRINHFLKKPWYLLLKKWLLKILFKVI